MPLIYETHRLRNLALVAYCAVFPTLLALTGCGGSQTSAVSGVVSLEGVPLPSGRIAFQCAGGDLPVLVASIQDGAYLLAEVPYGKVQATVETFRPARHVRIHNAPSGIQEPLMGADVSTEKKGKYVPLSIKYAHAKTSGLATVINAKQQTADFELTNEG